MEDKEKTCLKMLTNAEEVFENKDILRAISEFLEDHELLTFLLVIMRLIGLLKD